MYICVARHAIKLFFVAEVCVEHEKKQRRQKMWEEFVFEDARPTSGHDSVKGVVSAGKNDRNKNENKFRISLALRAALTVEIREWLSLSRDRDFTEVVLYRGADVFEKAVNEFKELRDVKSKDNHKNFPRDIVSEYTMG